MAHNALAEHVQYCREQVRRKKKSCQQLAEELGVSERAIQACVYGHTYDHIPGALKSPKRRRKPRVRTEPLTADEVRQIRADYAAGKLSVREIADKHGISKSYVSRLGRGMERQDVPGGVLDRAPVRKVSPMEASRRGEKHPNSKLDALCVIGIRALVRHRVPHAKIADIFGTTPENVSMISNRKRWRHVPDVPITPTALQHLPPEAARLLEEKMMQVAS